jgi:glycosyltransferase involved in cell wall biosynthesis
MSISWSTNKRGGREVPPGGAIKRNRRPRICFAVAYFPKYYPAGAEVQTYFLARHMLARHWSVHFTSDDCGQPTAKLQNEQGIWVHKLKSTRLFNPRRCWSFYRELVRINADVYYQRGGREYTFVTSLVARALGKKFVWGTSSDFDCERDQFRRILRDDKSRGMKRAILYVDALVRDALVSLGRKRADVIVVQTAIQRTRLRENLGFESVIIKTGHPLPETVPDKDSPPVVLWIANIKRLKRAEAFVELARKCTDLPARFLLVGRCTLSSYCRQLRRLSRGLDNLEWVGPVPFQRTNELLSGASVLVNTSTFEGFPNTFVQAWLRETPAVSLTVDPDGILEQENIGFCSGTFARMVEHVRLLLSDESLRADMGRRARAYAMREHNLADKVEQYAEIFEKLCSESRMVQPN